MEEMKMMPQSEWEILRARTLMNEKLFFINHICEHEKDRRRAIDDLVRLTANWAYNLGLKQGKKEKKDGT